MPVHVCECVRETGAAPHRSGTTISLNCRRGGRVAMATEGGEIPPPNPRRGGWEARRGSPSAPMETSLTPLLAMKSRALLTLEILWTLIFPRSGLARRSPAHKHTSVNISRPANGGGRGRPRRLPEMTSSSSMSLRPSRRSSSMFSI